MRRTNYQFDILLKLCNLFDIYGYAKQNNNKPITSVDTILQMMTLCEECHTGTNSTNNGSPTGVHNLPFNQWILQKVAKISPIPREGETLEFVQQEIKDYQEKEGENVK